MEFPIVHTIVELRANFCAGGVAGRDGIGHTQPTGTGTRIEESAESHKIFL